MLEYLYYIGHLRAPCSYLPGRRSSLLYLDGRDLGTKYRLLLDAGYRRSGSYIYCTDCGSCNECRVLRTPLQTFCPSKSQKRVWNNGERIFETRIVSPAYTADKAELYALHLESQHGSGDSEITEEHYREFFLDGITGVQTYEMQLYANGRLTGVGVFDVAGDAVSSVYFFFHPDVAKYSPGVYSMLKELEFAQGRGLAYYYPGYYIADCQAMSYKRNFRPCEIRDVATGCWDGPDNV